MKLFCVVMFILCNKLHKFYKAEYYILYIKLLHVHLTMSTTVIFYLLVYKWSVPLRLHFVLCVYYNNVLYLIYINTYKLVCVF